MGRTKPIVANEYLAGLTDGEGCFHVNMAEFPNYKSGTRVQLHFHIKMQEKDRPLLEKVKNTLKCGEVYLNDEVEMDMSINEEYEYEKPGGFDHMST